MLDVLARFLERLVSSPDAIFVGLVLICALEFVWVRWLVARDVEGVNPDLATVSFFNTVAAGFLAMLVIGAS